MSPAGGVERVLSRHINFLSSSFNVILLTKDNNRSFYSLEPQVEYESIDVEFNLNMNSRFSRFIKIILKLIKTRNNLIRHLNLIKPDIIYVATPLNLLELYLSNINMNKVIVTEHSSFQSYNFIYKIIVKSLYKKVKVLTVPTTLDSNFYNSIGINNVYLPNPLSFYPNYSSSLDNKIVLNVGRLTNDKRHDLLLKIWALSSANKNNWKLRIIGKGENESKIKELIDKYGLNESVTLNPVTNDIINEFYRSSIFALTSRAEGFGLVLAESMSLGVPCIAFNCPSGPKDIISNNYNGYLIEEGNINDYVAKLNNLINDYDLRIRMGKNSKIDILKFSENKISNQLISIINKNFSNV